LTQNQLSRILFPVGKFKKPEIRKKAEKMQLPVFDKEESQGLCFTPEKTPTKFIKRNLTLSPGDIITTEGKKIGTHEGLELYTIGQRKGINIGGDGPYFVVGRDFKKNQLIVTNDENDSQIYRSSMLVQIKNWIAGEPTFPLEVNVKIRYRHQLVRAVIRGHVTQNTKHKTQKMESCSMLHAPCYVLEVDFFEKQKAVTPGQSAVFYADDNEVLGGGIII
jgi:tRNA-specific 2-thiouridylase